MLGRNNALTIGVVIVLAASCLATVRHPEDEWQEDNKPGAGARSFLVGGTWLTGVVDSMR